MVGREELKTLYPSCMQKQQAIIELFAKFSSFEEKYQHLIDMGKRQKKFDAEEQTEEKRVQGCQSVMYLKLWLLDGKVFFETQADALISAGLGELIREVYSGEPIQAVLHCPPEFLQITGLLTHLSPSRVNGLVSLLSKIRSEVKKLMNQQT